MERCRRCAPCPKESRRHERSDVGNASWPGICGQGRKVLQVHSLNRTCVHDCRTHGYPLASIFGSADSQVLGEMCGCWRRLSTETFMVIATAMGRTAFAVQRAVMTKGKA